PAGPCPAGHPTPASRAVEGGERPFPQLLLKQVAFADQRVIGGEGLRLQAELSEELTTTVCRTDPVIAQGVRRTTSRPLGP
ncbi:hypothetical protein, partial [Streptomyces chartreusis]|uniref:hypothetical protein n=1 Tax=Streptomyces chartreusis TaxID=1969 RepID=UPI0033FE2665